MKRIVRLLAILLLIGALVAAGYWYLRGRGAAPTSVDTYTQIVVVERGDLDSSITVVGTLSAPQNVTLTFEHLSGTTPLLTLDVQPGSVVTAGQTVATVDPAPYEQMKEQARGDLQAAEKKLADLQTPVTELDIARADLAVTRAELQVQQAGNALDELLKPDLTALRSAVADARAALERARADLVAQQEDAATAEQLAWLREAEATAAAEHARLANETYDDIYHRDRLQVAFNEMMDAADARITAETRAQIAALGAQVSVHKAELALAGAQKALREAETGGDPGADLKLAEARLAVREAEVGLLAAREARAKLDAGPDALALATAQADVARKRLAVEEAETALAGTTLRASLAGTVLAADAAVGSMVTANSPIATIADLTQLQVIASVDEMTIRQVTAGQAAAVTFDALPGRVLDGAVVSVPLQGKPQGGVTMYQVPVALDGAADLPLLVGMTANVAIQTGQVRGGLLVPAMALLKVGGVYQVQVPNATDPEGPPEIEPVEGGLSDGTYTEVLSGLDEGDRVIVELSEGDDMFGFGGMMGPRPSRGP